jgi:hypothetical protein
MKELVLNVCFLHPLNSHMKVCMKKFDFSQVCCMTVFKTLCFLSHTEMVVLVKLR